MTSLFRPLFNERNLDFVTHPLYTKFVAELNMCIRSQVMRSVNCIIKWNNVRDKIPKSFIEML